MNIVKVLISLSIALTGNFAFAGDQFVVSDTQDLMEAMASDVAVQNIVLEIQDKDAFVAELQELRLISNDIEANVFENPEAVLAQVTAPVGNAAHRYRRGGYYSANPVFFIALLIVLSTPAYY